MVSDAAATPAESAGADVVITPYPDGPLVVRGPARFVDPDGVALDPGRATVALCRCGRSAVKPFCDGTHKTARFRAGRSAHRMDDPPGEGTTDRQDGPTGAAAGTPRLPT